MAGANDSGHVQTPGMPSVAAEALIGLLISGGVLESIAHWTAFVKVDKLLILVPIMLNLKGNLEMNLSLRMSTAVRRRRSAVH